MTSDPDFIECYKSCYCKFTGNDTVIGFLPFGSAHGDSTAPMLDDGSTNGIQLGTDIVIFGSHQNRLYVSNTFLSVYCG